MRIRKDGETTRQKILDAASRVFGEKGYREATHAEICRLAGVNTASINYHFGSKDALYRATWDHLAARLDAIYPIDGGVSQDAPAEERLAGNIRALLSRKADRTELGDFHKIRMRELMNPTGLLDEAIAGWLHRTKAYTRGIIQELLGQEASDFDIELCEMSLISQCFMAQGPPGKKKRLSLWRFSEKDIGRLAQHITTFCLAGIAALRRQLSQQKGESLHSSSYGDPHDVS